MELYGTLLLILRILCRIEDALQISRNGDPQPWRGHISGNENGGERRPSHIQSVPELQKKPTLFRRPHLKQTPVNRALGNNNLPVGRPFHVPVQASPPQATHEMEEEQTSVYNKFIKNLGI